VPGFSARLRVVAMPHVNPSEYNSFLLKSLTKVHLVEPVPRGMYLTLMTEEACSIVYNLGGDMGSIAMVLELRRAGMSVRGMIPTMILLSLCFNKLLFHRCHRRHCLEFCISFVDCTLSVPSQMR